MVDSRLNTRSNVQKSNGKYLWWALLGLGFQPDVAASHGASKANAKHTNLGPSMFDRPNKDAFYIVNNFLLEKLNPTRFRDEYRFCWPVLDHKADAVYRKVTCAWLRDIMDGSASTGPKVVASLFQSPAGPKFINLMLHLANHVMLQEVKTFSTDGTWFPEAAGSPASSADTAVSRLQLVETRFVRGAVDQDRLLQEYQKQAQCQVKSLRDRRAEDAKHDDLRDINKDTDLDRTALAQKIQKVRSLWLAVDGVSTALEAERRVMESVVRGDLNQFTLDGNDLALQIPPAVLQRLERLHQQESVGSVYEAGQVNLLSTLELLNHALRLLGEERSKAVGHAPVGHAPQLDGHALLEMSLQTARSLEDLQLMRKKISKEDVPEMKSLIRMLEEDWDQKWAETLKRTPLTSFLNEDLALEFLSPMAPLSFEPASEASFRSSVFSQFPAKLLEFHEEPAPLKRVSGPAGTAVGAVDADITRRTGPPVVDGIVTPLSARVVNSHSPITPLLDLVDSPLAVPLRAPSPAPLKAVVSQSGLPRPKLPAAKKNAQILDWECDNLADEFSEAVTTSPAEGSVAGLDLGSLLSKLATDPFSTRKQLPRTPESLIRDVKSSWRKALEEGEAQKSSPSSKVDGVFADPTPVSTPVSSPPTPASAPTTPVSTPLTPVSTPLTPVSSPPTPSTPASTPLSPVSSPPTPVSTPLSPVSTPLTPVSSPPTPSTPASTPLSPVSSPPTPVSTPLTPVSAPSTPVSTPPTPVSTPLTPVSAPSTPASTPLSPVSSPPTPVSTPLSPPTPDAPSRDASPDPTTASVSPGALPRQQVDSLMSTLSWDSSNMDVFHSLNDGGGGSSGLIQFSVAHETLPLLPCGDGDGDSLLSDSLVDSPAAEDDDEEEEEELLLPHIPSLTTDAGPALLAARKRLNGLRQACGEASFTGAGRPTPEPSALPCDGLVSNSSDWLTGMSDDTAMDKVFSLDLEALDSPSPPNKEQYSLPQLITFSPM